MAIDKKKIKRELIDELIPMFTDLSFVNQSVEFKRKTQYGWDRIIVVFYEYKDRVDVTFSMGIRVNSVEEIYHRTSGFEAKYQKGTSTIGCFIGDLLKKDKTYQITDQKDIHSTSLALFKDFETYALDYFKSYHDVNVIDSLLNENPNEITIHKGFLPHRAHIGTIVAKIVNNPNFDSIVNQYLHMMEKFNDGFYLNDYRNLLADLGSVSK